MKLSKIKKLHGRGARVQYNNEDHPEWDWTTDRTGQEDPFTGYKHLIFRRHPEDKGKFKSNWFTDPEELVDGVWYKIMIEDIRYFTNGSFFSKTNRQSVIINCDGDVIKGHFLANHSMFNKARKLYPKEIETLYTKYPEARPNEDPKVEWITDIDSLEDGVWHELDLECGTWYANGGYFKKSREKTRRSISSNGYVFKGEGTTAFRDDIRKARTLSDQEVQNLYTKYPKARPEEKKVPEFKSGAVFTGNLSPDALLPSEEEIQKLNDDFRKHVDEVVDKVKNMDSRRSFKVGEEVYVKGVIVSVCDMAGGNSEVKFSGKDGVDYARTYQFINEDILKAKTCV